MPVLSLPHLAFDGDRLATFQQWSFVSLNSTRYLARLGFAYLGKGTSITCIYCGGNDASLHQISNPLTEHLKRTPYCAMLRKRAEVATRLLSFDSVDGQHPAYCELLTRKVSFASWPIQISQTGTEMARAGFFYNERADEVCNETPVTRFSLLVLDQDPVPD